MIINDLNVEGVAVFETKANPRKSSMRMAAFNCVSRMAARL
jgi:hypothetical protein